MTVCIIPCPKPKERSAKLLIKRTQASLAKCTTIKSTKSTFCEREKKADAGFEKWKKVGQIKRNMMPSAKPKRAKR